MSLKTISQDDCMLDVDEAAWKSIVERRGGCSCHLSPPCNNCVNPVTEDELNSVGYTYEDADPEKWGSYFDGDERVTIYETKGEAVGEIECEIDREHEPGEEIAYCVAPMLSGKHILRNDSAQRIGDNVFEQINERVNGDMYAEEDPLDMTPEDRLALGQLVVDFICTHAKVQWWTVDNKREQKHTYVAGSNDAPATQHLPADDTEGGAA